MPNTKARLLIVDDEPSIRMSLSLVLHEIGYFVRTAADGLSALRSVIRGSPARLTDGGRLLVEHGYNQSDTVRRLLTTHGFMKVQSWRDLAGIERVSGGGRP